MPRLKITGYIDTDELPADYVDLDHSTGLSEEGFLALAQGDGGPALTLSSLEDVETEVVED